MAIQLSDKKNVLRRPALRVLSGGAVEAGGAVESVGPEVMTSDPVGAILDEILHRLPGPSAPVAHPDEALWRELHKLLAQLPPSSPALHPRPIRKPSPRPPVVPVKKVPVPKVPVNQVPKPASHPVAPAAPRTYTVQPGDSLSAIAQKTLGDANRWPEIYALNRSVVGADPNLIYSGEVLQLPGGGASPAPSTPTPTPTPTPSPAPGASSGEPWNPGQGQLNGADTSSWQSIATFSASIQGSQWTALKASQGTGFTDPTFQARWNLLGQKIAQGSMKLRMAYCFLDPGNGAAQAQHFLNVVGVHGKLPAGTRLALDWEGPALSSPATLRDAANYIHQVTGTWPVIYVQGSKMSVAQSAVPQAPIWEAAWGPSVNKNVPFVQYSDGPNYDHDVFNGSIAALNRFAGWTA